MTTDDGGTQPRETRPRPRWREPDLPLVVLLLGIAVVALATLYIAGKGGVAGVVVAAAVVASGVGLVIAWSPVPDAPTDGQGELPPQG